MDGVAEERQRMSPGRTASAMASVVLFFSLALARQSRVKKRKTLTWNFRSISTLFYLMKSPSSMEIIAFSTKGILQGLGMYQRYDRSATHASSLQGGRQVVQHHRYDRRSIAQSKRPFSIVDSHRFPTTLRHKVCLRQSLAHVNCASQTIACICSNRPVIKSKATLRKSNPLHSSRFSGAPDLWSVC